VATQIYNFDWVFPIDPASIEFTRPTYPYPKQVRYNGAGDSSQAENFHAVDPPPSDR